MEIAEIIKDNIAPNKIISEINILNPGFINIEISDNFLQRNFLNAKAILLTLSSKGICVNSKDNFQHTPAFKRNIIDVSGAGDTVISVASLCLGSNIDLSNLSILASLAGGIVCEEVGVIPINKEKLLCEAKKHISV